LEPLVCCACDGCNDGIGPVKEFHAQKPLLLLLLLRLCHAGVEGIVLLLSANDGSGPVCKFLCIWPLTLLLLLLLLCPAGVEGIVLLFSANDGSGPVYKFPAYDYFKDALEPLLEEVRALHLQHDFNTFATPF
jgi:hypothetical protein